MAYSDDEAEEVDELRGGHSSGAVLALPTHHSEINNLAVDGEQS